MNNILRQIDMNIARKKLEYMKKEIKNMEDENCQFKNKLNNISETYDIILYKKHPVGSSSSAIKYLKKL